MSNPRAKAERSRAKDMRQMPAHDGVMKGKRRKRDKPYVVWHWWGMYGWGWIADKRFASMTDARKHVAKLQRNYTINRNTQCLVIGIEQD